MSKPILAGYAITIKEVYKSVSTQSDMMDYRNERSASGIVSSKEDAIAAINEFFEEDTQ
jgi:hypothetical protein